MTEQLQKILIPKPMQVPINRGPYAINANEDMKRHVTFSRLHDANVMRAAEICDVPITTFIRWCATYAAEEIVAGRFHYDTDNGGKG